MFTRICWNLTIFLGFFQCFVLIYIKSSDDTFVDVESEYMRR